MTNTPQFRVGCSGVPAGLRRDRFFEKLSFLECPETFADPPRLKGIRSWRRDSPKGRFGLVASRTITHTPPVEGFSELPRELSARAGEYRDTDVVRDAIERFAEQVRVLEAEVVVFRSPANLSRSAEDRLRVFFTEIATPDVFGGATRVWEPGPLWEIEPAIRLAEDLDLVLSVDPLGDNPLAGSAPRAVDRLPRDRPAYLRLRGLGRAKSRFRDFEIEELAETVQEFETAWVVFANQEKNRSARLLSRLLAEAA